MKATDIGLFLSGLLIGGAGGVLGTRMYFKKKYEAKADAEIEEMRSHFDRYLNASVSLDERVEEYMREDDILNNRPYTREEMREVKSQVHTARKPQDDTNYTAMYQSGGKMKTMEELEDEASIYENEDIDPAEDEAPEEELIWSSVTERTIGPKPKAPRIISAEAAGDLPVGVENQILYFYSLDETLVDEEENEIVDPEVIVGDCLVKYNFVDNDEMLIFVMNYELGVCYEIQKVLGSWGAVKEYR